MQIPFELRADEGVPQVARQIETEGLRFSFDLRTGFISDVQLGSEEFTSRGTGGIYFIDGKTGEMLVPFEIETTRTSEKSIAYRIKGGPKNMDVAATLSWTGEAVKWHVDIENKGEDTQFIEVRLGLPIVPAHTLRYWDGYDGMDYGYPDGKGGVIPRRLRQATEFSNMVSHGANPSLIRPNVDNPRISMRHLAPAMLFTFPLNLVFGREAGIALGADPNFLMSYYAGGVQPGFSSHESFYYALKYVIQPTKIASQGFVLYSFQPDGFGYRPALARYYASFPERFGRRKKLNPRTLKVGSGLHKGHMEVNDLWTEYCRRNGLGYVWFYAGHDKTGNFWPEDGDSKKAACNRKALTEFIHQVQKGCMVGYYTIPNRCEIGLAQKKFSDSITRTVEGRPRIKGQVLHDETLATMYPWGNRYGEHLKENLPRIVEEGGAQALAFDNAFAADFNYGLALTDSLGAAFMSPDRIQGAFASVSKSPVLRPVAYVPAYIGYARLMDDLRERFESDGKEVAFIGNNPWALPTAIRCDAGYLEWHWQPPLKRVGIFQAQRYLMGGMRPISYKIAGRWSGDPERLTPEERNRITHERKFSLLHLFRYGGYPVMRKHMGAGDPDCLAAIPTLEKLCRAGWTPVSGVRHDRLLWIERFGEKEQMYLSIINPTARPYSGCIKLENAYLGKGYRWFAPLFGDQDSILCRSHGGRTDIEVSVPATWVQVLESSLEVTPAAGDAALKGSVTLLPGKMIVLIESDRPGPLEFTVFLPEEAHDARVILKGGDALECTQIVNGCRFCLPEVPVGAPVELTITWKGAFHLVNRQEIMAFPFLDESQPGCEIVVQDRCLETATRLQLYFAYWQLQKEFTAWLQGRQASPPPGIFETNPIPIRSQPSGKHKAVIFLGDADFVREQTAIYLDEDVAIPEPTQGKPLAAALSHGDKALLLLLFDGQDGGMGLAALLNELDSVYTTLPGYDANYDRYRTMDETGRLYDAFPGQPIMGWTEFLGNF